MIRDGGGGGGETTSNATGTGLESTPETNGRLRSRLGHKQECVTWMKMIG